MGKLGIDFSVAPWMRYAEGELGVAEVQGSTDNQRILEYLATTTYGGTLHDEVPWCSAFVNWCLRQAALAGTSSAAANSWMHWGKMLSEPQAGCVVIVGRQDPNNHNAAHVAFFVKASQDGKQIDLLGGNQHDSVKVSSFSVASVLGYRWPAIS
jgi:uncharacterized protein (TIGR02594 family)